MAWHGTPEFAAAGGGWNVENERDLPFRNLLMLQLQL